MLKRAIFPVVARLLQQAYPPPKPNAPHRPDAPPFAHRGLYAVGTRDLVLYDEDMSRRRQLPVTVWYPSNLSPDAPQEAIYTMTPMQFAGNATTNAPWSEAQSAFPLVVFSHGSGGLRYQSLFLMEHLASHGFIVMAVDHVGNTFLDGMLYGHQYEKMRLVSYVQRPLDMSRMIDYAVAQFPVDVEQIAAIGHSFGGYTVFNLAGAAWDFNALRHWCTTYEEQEKQSLGGVAYLQHHIEFLAKQRGLESAPEAWEPLADPRIKALVTFAPYNAPVFGQQNLAAVKLPTLVMVGTTDPVTIPERDAYQYYDWIGSTQKGLVKFLEAGHFIYVDGCSPMARDFGVFRVCSDPVWDMERAHDLLNHITTAFLRWQLLKDTDALAALQHLDFSGIQLDSQNLA